MCLWLCTWQWMSSHCFFPPTYFGHWSFWFFNGKQFKKTTITSVCFVLFTVNSTGMFRHHCVQGMFPRMEQDCPCPQCLSGLTGEAVQYYKHLGRNSVRTTVETREGAKVRKLHQRADVRKGRGRDCKGDPIHHSFMHMLIPHTCVICLLFARNKGLGIQ